MSEVKRYDLTEDSEGNIEISAVHDRFEGRFVLHEDYAALQQKLYSVLAENAALKSGAEKVYDEITSIHSSNGWSVSEDGESNTAAIDLDGAQFVVQENLLDVKTPATDALLNEVRAQGLDMLASQLDGYAENHVYSHTKRHAEDFAAQLRAGKDSK